MNCPSRNSLADAWVAGGGTAYNGMAYGPPDSAHPYGTAGCPLAPTPYRSELGKIELPSGFCAALGASRLTVAELGLDAWQLLDSHELSPGSRQRLSAFLYKLSVPEEKVAIPGGVAISWLLALPTNPRLRNVLVRHFRETYQNEILQAPIYCEELLNIRGCGKAALIEIVCVLESVELGFVPEQTQARRASKPKGMSEEQLQAEIQEAIGIVPRTSEVMEDHFQDLAAWALSETGARTVGEAISLAASSPTSAASWRAITDLELTELTEIPRHPYDIIESWVVDQRERERYIFQKRLAHIGSSYTLQQLADELGITRERVRQLESQLFSKFTAWARKAAASPIRWRIETIKKKVGIAAPLGQIEQALHPDDSQTDYRSILLRLAGPYEISGDWVVLRSAIDNDPTEKVAAMVDEMGFIDQDLAERELTMWGLDRPYFKEWLTRTGRIREFKGRLARWHGSIGDKLIVVLSDLGSPASLDTLLGYIQEDRSRGTALNALSGDHRVVRVSRSHWALASWGLPEYSSIAMAIRTLVSHSSEPVHIKEIITSIQNNFGAAEGSIRAYCSAPMFVVEGGWVSLRKDLETFRYPSTSPRTARGVFVLGQGRVTLLVEVNEDLLRGSGRSIPTVLGAILDLPINEELTFSKEEGASITFTYPETSFVGPARGTARSLAESVGANLGDYLTIILDRCDMSVTGIATSIREHRPSWQLVARLTGIEADSGIKGLASALDCTVGEVRALLKSRGDDAVAQALPTESSTSNGLDEALSRLEAQLQKS